MLIRPDAYVSGAKGRGGAVLGPPLSEEIAMFGSVLWRDSLIGLVMNIVVSHGREISVRCTD